MYTIPKEYKKELDQYRQLVDQVERNETDAVKFKIFRVVRGIYEQRQTGTFMVRIRCAGGTISPKQLSFASNCAKKYNASHIHITTRQEIQLHQLKLKDTSDISEQLFEVGLSTKGSGGNTVRNIMASVESGVSKSEVFDIIPYNIALTNFLISREVSFDMPRKLKISFSCDENDTALAAFNDLGFIAKIQDGVKGFKVYIGGSPAVKPMVGHVLFEFLPANKIYGVALAVIDLFNRYGNRKNRHKARLRYVFYKHGKDQVFSFFDEIYNQYKTLYINEVPSVPLHEGTQNILKSEKVNSDEFNVWRKNYATPQKQNGLFTIVIPVMHGNISHDQSSAIAIFAQNFGDDSLRFSRRQNLHLRHIPESFLGNVYNLLHRIGIEINKPYILGNLVSCTGADTCQLGICFSKGGLKAIHDKLASNPKIHKLSKINVNISGCPNSCGQHLVADLGFAGKVSRNGKIYPAYNVYAGAIIEEGQATLPIHLGEVAAKDIPEFTNDILDLYIKKGNHQPFSEFIKKQNSPINIILEKYKKVPAYNENKKYYIDWGNNDLFTLEARGEGECSAGLLDLIEGEMKIIQKCKDALQGQQEVEEITILLNEIIISASKLLAYTVQKQPQTENELLHLIKDAFLDKIGFINNEAPIIDWVLDGNFTKLINNREIIFEFLDKTLGYYNNLDDSLQPKHTIKEITVKELKKLMDTNFSIKLIDVREAWEKEIADIGGELIPLALVEKSLESFLTEGKVIVYCRTGRRSAEAIKQVVAKLGLSNLYNLKGGIHAWADELDSSIQKY